MSPCKCKFPLFKRSLSEDESFTTLFRVSCFTKTTDVLKGAFTPARANELWILYSGVKAAVQTLA